MTNAIAHGAADSRVHHDLHLAPERPRPAWLVLVSAAVVFSVLSLAAAFTSDGFLEGDAGTHYLFARHAFAEPDLFFSVWGRPLCTGLYAIPATLGARIGVREMSLFLALVTAFGAYFIARGQKLRAAPLALLFTLAQPLVFLHSFSELTELPFAAVFALGFLAFQRRCWGLMAILIGILPLGRPEGFGLVLMAAFALLYYRRYLWAPLLGLPVLAWDIGGWLTNGRPGHWYLWLKSSWPYSQHSAYVPGALGHFVGELPMLVGPFIFPALWLGIWQCIRAAKRPPLDHQRICQWLIVLIPAGVLAVHSFLYRFGLMASNGELRYLMVASPLWAILCAQGWEWAFSHFHFRQMYAWAALAAVAPGLANIGYRVLPLTMSADWVAARDVVQWYKSKPAVQHDYPLVMCAHPALEYYLDFAPGDRQRELTWSTELIKARPPGVLVYWDPIYGLFNSDQTRIVPLSMLLENGWVNDPVAERDARVNTLGFKKGDAFAVNESHIFISPVTQDGRKVPTTQRSDGTTTWLEVDRPAR
jgi:hypothetical protein